MRPGKSLLGKSLAPTIGTCIEKISMKALDSPLAIHAFFLAGAMTVSAANQLESGDAHVQYNSVSNSWILGTGLIEQQLDLAGGRFRLSILKNKLTGTEFVGGQGSDEFHFNF